MSEAVDENGAVQEYTVTFLEMTAPPQGPRPIAPAGPPLAILVAQPPPVWWFLALYREVGRDWHWVDKLRLDPAALEAELTRPRISMHTLFRRGAPAGFFTLDATTPGRVELAYFGLVPEAVGQGLGRYLLDRAVRAAWDTPDCGSVTVNTCTLDHPRALGLYQRAGFVPTRRETRRRPATDPMELSC